MENQSTRLVPGFALEHVVGWRRTEMGLFIRFDDVSERGGIDEYENEKETIL